MSDQVIYLAIIIGLYVLYKLANSTDQPKIKGIPEIPGVPLFGNLIQLGTDHARVAQKWAKKYGPVFQTRLGTKVRIHAAFRIQICFEYAILTIAASHLCQLL